MNLKEVVAKYPNNKAFFKAVKVELKKLATEKADFTYFSPKTKDYNFIGCKYDSGPDCAKSRCSGCIFGQALRKLGWTDKDERSRVATISQLFEDKVCMDVPKYWSMIQTMNDNNKPWGKFLKYLK